MIHYFKDDISGIDIPDRFTFPFYYRPHRLTVMAADEVKSYVATRSDWHDEISKGKMFGVLVVKTSDGRIGFLAAFSGNLAGSNVHDYFVPPVYDLLRPDGFFRIGESEISEMNRKVSELQRCDEYVGLKKKLEETVNDGVMKLAKAKEWIKEGKRKRDEIRKSAVLTAEEEFALVRESQFQKAEYKRLENSIKEEKRLVQERLKAFDDEISALKNERKVRSADLQKRLFMKFEMLDALGERKNLIEIFKDTPQVMPPAGAGECALPKMLQYAYLNGMHPLAMGEFWCGMSPKDEIRQDGKFYPSCKGKCEPILKHMLVGLDVAPNPLLDDNFKGAKLDILYEDEWIVVVDKPSGMLSVPGKNDIDSVSQRLHEMYPEATGPLVVHRLDMATSGILLAAKDKDVHAALQALFETRCISKEYTAILDGVPACGVGEVSLPICLNPLDRPRQMVDYELGKPALTKYEILKVMGDRCMVKFLPHTGRTHQLRVHSAHSLGLGSPISGDELYGNPSSASRLCLHASRLVFTHPVTKKVVDIKSPVPFNL